MLLHPNVAAYSYKNITFPGDLFDNRVVFITIFQKQTKVGIEFPEKYSENRFFLPVVSWKYENIEKLNNGREYKTNILRYCGFVNSDESTDMVSNTNGGNIL